MSSRATQKKRILKQAAYRNFRLSKKIKHSSPKKLSGSFKLLKKSLSLLTSHPKLFGGIIAVQLVLTIVLVRGLGGGLDIAELKAAMNEIFGGELSRISTSFALFGYLITSAGQTASESGAVYQTILTLIISLVIIWALRHTSANKKTTIREAFYKGTFPLVPFILVLIVLGLQLVPFIVGNTLYSIVVNGGLAVTFLEKFVWLLLLGATATLSLYMVCSSIFALYIVTLPDMTPMKALRSARQLVLHRRWAVIRRFIFLAVALLVIVAAVLVPLIIFAAPAAEWVFFLMNMAALAVVHSYLYSLYRELL